MAGSLRLAVMLSTAKVVIFFELAKGLGEKFHAEGEITLDCVESNVRSSAQ